MNRSCVGWAERGLDVPRRSKYPDVEIFGPKYYTQRCFWDLIVKLHDIGVSEVPTLYMHGPESKQTFCPT